MQKCLGLEDSKLVMLSLDSEKICIARPVRELQFVLRGEGISHAAEASQSPLKICDARACITDIARHSKYA